MEGPLLHLKCRKCGELLQWGMVWQHGTSFLGYWAPVSMETPIQTAGPFERTTVFMSLAIGVESWLGRGGGGRILNLLPGTSLYTPAWDPKFVCWRLLPKTRRSEDQHERTQELAELSALTQEVKRSKQPLKGPVGLGLWESVSGCRV